MTIVVYNMTLMVYIYIYISHQVRSTVFAECIISDVALYANKMFLEIDNRGRAVYETMKRISKKFDLGSVQVGSLSRMKNPQARYEWVVE